jgi:addiction module HigA family antidote
MKISQLCTQGPETALFGGHRAKGVPPDTVDKLRKMFVFLDAMQQAEELRALDELEGSHIDRRPQRHMEFERYAQPPFDVHYRRRARNLRPEFRGLPLTQREYRTMPMKNPPHPGDFIRTEIIEPAGLSVTAAAAALQVSRPALSSLLNSKADLSGEMALRIEKAFGVKMETLMRMQSAFDIAKTRSREKEIRVPAPLSSPRIKRKWNCDPIRFSGFRVHCRGWGSSRPHLGLQTAQVFLDRLGRDSRRGVHYTGYHRGRLSRSCQT